MNAQEIFDKVATHLFTQGRRATDADGERCMYRAPNGDSCAAGCLIPDEMYNSGMEGATIDIVTEEFRLPEYFYDYGSMSLIREFQKIHDDYDQTFWKSAESMKRRLLFTSETHGLSSNVLETLELKEPRP